MIPGVFVDCDLLFHVESVAEGFHKISRVFLALFAAVDVF